MGIVKATSMMTGFLPFEFGFYLGIRKHLMTLAEAFKISGYRTYVAVSENPALYPSYGYNRGFDVYIYRPISKNMSKNLKQ